MKDHEIGWFLEKLDIHLNQEREHHEKHLRRLCQINTTLWWVAFWLSFILVALGITFTENYN